MNAVVAIEPSRERWEEFLTAIKEGLAVDKALMQCGITSREFELTVLDPIARQRWQEARLLAKKSAWSVLDREEMCLRISRGVKIEEALIEVRGHEDPTFFELVESDEDFHADYMRAMKARSLRDMDKLLDIADDDTKDVLSGPKGDIPNMAAVNRSRLMVETRRELAGNFWPKLFGQEKAQVNVQVNVNHAERLERANEQLARGRAGLSPGLPRAADGKASIQLSREERARAIDAVFAETPVPTRAEKAAVEATRKPAAPASAKVAPAPVVSASDPLDE